MKSWTKVHIERAPELGGVHWVALTNDDNTDGEPDGYICVTQGFGASAQDIVKLWGRSRIENGRKIDVYVNGQKVK